MVSLHFAFLNCQTWARIANSDYFNSWSTSHPEREMISMILFRDLQMRPYLTQYCNGLTYGEMRFPGSLNKIMQKTSVSCVRECVQSHAQCVNFLNGHFKNCILRQRRNFLGFLLRLSEPHFSRKIFLCKPSLICPTSKGGYFFKPRLCCTRTQSGSEKSAWFVQYCFCVCVCVNVQL